MGPDRPKAEKDAQWWRMAFNATEEVTMIEDDPQNPRVVMFEFPDGLDEEITPSSFRHQSPKTRLAEDNKSLLPEGEKRTVAELPEFFDVLTVGRPTDSLRWNPLTAPGNHRHPDQRW